MLNKFLKSLSLLLILNLMIKPLWVLEVDRHVQLTVGDGAYGLYFAMYSFTLWFSTLLDPGIKNYFQIHISQKRSFFPEEISSFLSLKFVLSLSFAAILFIAAWINGDYLAEGQLLFFLGLNQTVLSFLLFLRGCLSGLGYYKLDSIMSVTDRLFMILLIIPVFYLHYYPDALSTLYFVKVHGVAYAFSCLLVLFFLRRHLGAIKFRFSLKGAGPHVRRSLPFALFTALMVIYFRTDVVMIEQLLPDGAVQAGIYAKGFRFLEAASMFALLFGNLLLPVLSNQVSKRESTIQIVSTSFKLLSIPAIILAALCFIHRLEIMAFFYEGSSVLAANCFGWLMLGFIGLSLFYVFGSLLTAHSKIRLLNIYAFVGVLVNITINFTLIPRIGIFGAVLATVVTLSTVSLLQVTSSMKLLKMNISTKAGSRFVLFVISSLALFYAGKDLPIPLLVNLFLMTTLSFTFALLLGVFSLKELRVVLNQNQDEGKSS